MKRVIRRVKRFFGWVVKVFQYAIVLRKDTDYDWAFALSMFQYKLKRIRQHILEHNLIVDADKVGQEIQEVVDLIDYVLEDFDAPDFEEKWNLLWTLVNKNLRNWWC